MTDQTPDPALAVACPYEGGCGAPAGTPCHTRYGDEVHAERRRLADLRSLEHGVCDLCGRPMVRGSVEGAPIDAWHPDPAHHGCPPLADPREDWDAYALALQQGLKAGHPGVEHFVPTGEQADPTTALSIGAATVGLTIDGVTSFSPTDVGTVAVEVGVICPECQNGKCQNCDGRGLHPVTDELTACTCSHGAPA